MRRFESSLTPLLRLREQEERAAQTALAAAQARVEQAARLLAQTEQHYRDVLLGGREQLSGPTSGGLLNNLFSREESARRLVDAAREKVEETRAAAESAMQDLLSARQNSRAVNLRVDGQRRQHVKNERRAEELAMSERASQRHIGEFVRSGELLQRNQGAADGGSDR